MPKVPIEAAAVCTNVRLLIFDMSDFLLRATIRFLLDREPACALSERRIAPWPISEQHQHAGIARSTGSVLFIPTRARAAVSYRTYPSSVGRCAAPSWICMIDITSRLKPTLRREGQAPIAT